jgi:hypothetical protein
MTEKQAYSSDDEAYSYVIPNYNYVDPNAIELEGEYTRQEMTQAALDEALHAAGKFVY